MTRSLELPPDLSASLVLVRHGESVWIAEGRFQGRLDPPLSALGVRQAALVGARLAERRDATLPLPDSEPVGIWHSPLSRAADTARAIAHAQPAEPPLHPTGELTELAQGQWEGLPHAEVSARWPEELAQWRLTPTTAHAPGGESLLEAAGRVASALEAIVAALGRSVGSAPGAADRADDTAPLHPSPVPGYPPPPCAAGAAGAGGPPWAVLVAHDGIFRLILMTLLELPYERFWSFPFHLCGISVISLSEGVAALRCHNVTDHLAPLAAEARAAAEARGDRRGAL